MTRSSRSGSGASRHDRTHTSSARDRGGEPGRTRTVDKSRTRRALLDGALVLLADRSIDRLGLREVTREAGVAPAAFYRHFDRIDDLGLVLVDEAFASLRELMRTARRAPGAGDVIDDSVAVLFDHIHEHPAHYRFIARERFSAVLAVRLAIRRELRLFATELATDLARLPGVSAWPTEDLIMLAELIVDLMVNTAERLLEVLDEEPGREAAVQAETERRLRYLALGATAWRPDLRDRPTPER